MGTKPASNKANNQKNDVMVLPRPSIMPYVPGGQSVGDDFQGYDNIQSQEINSRSNIPENDLNTFTGGKNNFDSDALFFITNMSI